MKNKTRLEEMKFPGTAAPVPSEAEVAARVDAILGRMSLEEKIGQLTQIGGASFVPGPKPEDVIRKGGAGSVLWLNDTKQFNALQKIAVEESPSKIPLLFALDVIHGYRTIFPVPLALASSWDPAVAERAQAVAAREARAAGLHWTFGPMLDIARDARWGRIVEGAGEDPCLGAAMAAAQVRGFQGPSLGAPDRVVACAKHFAGYGAADGGRDYDPVYLSEGQLRNVYFPPFEAAVKAGVGTFMSAYMDLNDVPASGNRFLLRDVLRGEWGFKGFVVSDAFAVGSLVTEGFARDGRDAAFRALRAGLDMDMASNTYLQHLAGLVEDGALELADIEAAVRPILAIKVRLGLFEQPYTDESKLAQVVALPEHRKEARLAAQRSMVLLRNEGRLLPLAQEPEERGRDRTAGRLAGGHGRFVDGLRPHPGSRHSRRRHPGQTAGCEGGVRPRPRDPARHPIHIRRHVRGQEGRADARAGGGRLPDGRGHGAGRRSRRHGPGRERRHGR